MFSNLIAVPIFVCLCTARPQEPAPPSVAAAPASKGSESPPIPIINQTDETNPDGSFHFSFETGNGIKIEQKGYLKDGANASEKIQVIEGSASYTDSDGNPVNLKFIADENGYQPEGDHIPKAPGQEAPGVSGAAPPAQQRAAPPAPAPAQPAPAPAQPAPEPAQPAPEAAQPAAASTEAAA